MEEKSPPNNLYSILNLRLNSTETPPEFTEPATIVAMSNLKISSKELLTNKYISDNTNNENDQENQLRASLNYEIRRFDLVEKIINERNRILNSNFDNKEGNNNSNSDHNNNNNSNKNIKGKTHKKKKIKAKKKKILNLKSHLPPLYFKKASSEPPLPTNRRFQPNKVSEQLSLVDMKLSEAASYKKQKENDQLANAERALEKVKEAERRHEELNKKKDEYIKTKAAIRLKRLKNMQEMIQAEKEVEQQKAKAVLTREEKKVANIKKMKNKIYFKEQKWREINVYGPLKLKKRKKTVQKNDQNIFIPRPPNFPHLTVKSPRIRV